MAKDEIVRTAIGAAESVAVSSKQSEVNALLKKKAVEVAEKNQPHDQAADADQAAAAAPAEGDAAALQLADASDVLGIASDAGSSISPSVLLSGASGAGETGGISNTTLLVGGGVLLAGGAIAIASNSGGNGNDDDVVVPAVVSVAAPATVNEGSTVAFVITGTPGSTVAYTLTGTAAQGTDYTVPAGNSVTFGLDGKAVVTVTVVADGLTEAGAPETIILTAGGQSATVSITDSSIAVPQQLVLTTDRDTLNASAPGVADTIEGIVVVDSRFGSGGGDGIYFVDSTRSTFSAGDIINGNGQTKLHVGIQGFDALGISGGFGFGDINVIPVIGPQTTLSNIAEVEFESNLASLMTFDASNWTSIGKVSLTGDSLTGPSLVGLINLENSTDLSVESSTTVLLEDGLFPFATGLEEAAGVNGLFSLYEDRTVVGLIAAGEGSATAYSDTKLVASAEEDGLVVGIVADGSLATLAGIYGGVLIPPISSPGLEISVASVDFTGDESGAAEVLIAQGQPIGGDVTVGNVNVTGFDGSLVAILNTGHSEKSPAVDTTVGNIVVEGNDEPDYAGDIGLGIFADDLYDSIEVDVVNGLINPVGEDSELDSLSLSDNNLNNAGNLTIGTTKISLGSEAAGTLYYANGAVNDDQTDSVVVGDTKIGNILVDVAEESQFTTSSFFGYSIVAGAYAEDGDATVGKVDVGSITANVASDSGFEFGILVEADVDSVATTNKTTVGNVSVGAVTLNGGSDNSDINYYVTVDSTDGDTGTVGNVVLGAIKADIKVDSSAIVSNEITATTDVGNVSLGNVELLAGKNSYINAWENSLLDVFAEDGSIGDVTVGTLKATSSTGGDTYAEVYLTAGDGIGDVKAGNISLESTGTNASSTDPSYTESDWDIDSGDGDIDSVEFGNVSLKSDLGSYSQFTVLVDSNSVANDVIGGIELGNFSIQAGKSASFYTNVYAEDIDSDVTVGDLDYKLTGTAGASASSGTSVFEADYGSVTVGDITVAAAGDNKDATTDSSLDVTVDGAFGVEIGDIVVTGTSEEVNEISDDSNSWLHIYTGVVSDITIDSIDYSGYTGATDKVNAPLDSADVGVIVDLTGAYLQYADVAVVKGSAGDDNLLDNGSVTIFTGSGGKDHFTFSNDNAGNTELGGIDQVLDYVSVGTADTVIFTVNTAVTPGDVTLASSDYETYEDLLADADDEFSGNSGGVFIASLDNENVFAVVDANGDGAFTYDDDYVVQFTGLTTVADFNVDSASIAAA